MRIRLKIDSFEKREDNINVVSGSFQDINNK